MSTTTKTNTTQSATQTPTNPSWVTTPLENLTSQITALGSVPAKNYVAPQTALQQQANAQGASLLSGTNPNYGAASSEATANASVNPGSISQWLNPYTNNVISAEDALINQQNKMQDAALAAQGAANQAFGGSNYAISQGVLGGQQQLNEQNINAGLLNQGYTNAQNAAFQNANLGQTAATNLANIGTEQSASNVAQTQALAQLGAAQQQTAQAQATAPIALAQAMAELYGANQFGLFQGQNATGQSSSTQKTTGIGAIGGLLGGLGSLGTGIGNIVGAF